MLHCELVLFTWQRITCSLDFTKSTGINYHIKPNPPARSEITVQLSGLAWEDEVPCFRLHDPEQTTFLTVHEVQSTPVKDRQFITFGSHGGTGPTIQKKPERRLLAG